MKTHQRFEFLNYDWLKSISYVSLKPKIHLSMGKGMIKFSCKFPINQTKCGYWQQVFPTSLAFSHFCIFFYVETIHPYVPFLSPSISAYRNSTHCVRLSMKSPFLHKCLLQPLARNVLSFLWRARVLHSHISLNTSHTVSYRSCFHIWFFLTKFIFLQWLSVVEK